VDLLREWEMAPQEESQPDLDSLSEAGSGNSAEAMSVLLYLRLQ